MSETKFDGSRESLLPDIDRLQATCTEMFEKSRADMNTWLGLRNQLIRARQLLLSGAPFPEVLQAMTIDPAIAKKMKAGSGSQTEPPPNKNSGNQFPDSLFTGPSRGGAVR